LFSVHTIYGLLSKLSKVFSATYSGHPS